ncbi:MAG: rod-binding protein [Ghiorsea sp.]
MRDLVETTIAQVMKKNPTMKSAQPTTLPDPLQANRVEHGVEIKDKELWGACCQFEAIFLQQMMAAMRKTVPESELSPKSYANSMYEGMMDQAISESGSKQAPLGFAINMYRQLDTEGAQSNVASPSIQDIKQAADTMKKLDLVNKPTNGAI